MIKKKKPMAARGKTTKKGKIKKVLKSFITGVKPKVSPKTKAKQMQALIKKMKTASPGMKKAITGSAVGMGSAGILAMARKLKPTGRLNAADLERVQRMMARTQKPTGRLNAADLDRLKKMMGKANGGEPMTKKDAEARAERLNRRRRRGINFKVVDTGQKGKGILSKLPVQASGKRFVVKGDPIKRTRKPLKAFRKPVK